MIDYSVGTQSFEFRSITGTVGYSNHFHGNSAGDFHIYGTIADEKSFDGRESDMLASFQNHGWIGFCGSPFFFPKHNIK
jgi:hypothetical protein